MYEKDTGLWIDFGSQMETRQRTSQQAKVLGSGEQNL